jgi:hypothetical protein
VPDEPGENVGSGWRLFVRGDIAESCGAEPEAFLVEGGGVFAVSIVEALPD